MKKLVVVIGILVIIGGYLYFQNTSQNPTHSSSNQSSSNTPSTPTTSASSGNGTNTTSSYKDGTYTGSVEDAVYGNVQVKATISGGKITDVVFLQFPNTPGHSTEVSNFAIPQLRQEAIQSQSAHVDVVSGATQTSQAFMQSLQSALSQAS